MFKPKTKLRLKRTLSGVLALAMTVSLAAVMPVAAEETAKYPYAVFAADEDAGITVNTDSLTLNGNAYTNGVFSATVQYPNINGTVTDNDDIENENNTEGEETEDVFDVSKDMILIHTKLTNKYFTENCDKYDEDYTYSDMNVNINNAIYVTGRLSLDGNISLNNAVGAVSDVDLSGGNLNGNNTVIYSKFGDIDISNSQATVNGLIYAPFGTVTIDCDNFNMNGLIIAQNVVIDGYGANINYSSSWAELVGTESEELSWTMDDWQYLADTDEDGLPNLIEKGIGSDPYNSDTDGDGLPDGYEALTLGTDPTKPDTDDNGVLDCDEDFDEDGLTNLQEYEQGTEPHSEDTDSDGLKDGEEINTYGTDPLKVDTDDDELEDEDEIYFETDPLNPDSDGNGISDGDEKRFQTFIHKVENEDCAVTEVHVTMEGTGNLQKTTTVESIMNKDILCSDVVGLVGEPFSIETTSQFDKATLTYVIDKSKLGDTEFDNLLFLWYDEENDNFVELDTVLDEINSTVSIETTHFSKYMVIDSKEWYSAWQEVYDKINDAQGRYTPNATILISKCSNLNDTNKTSRTDLIAENIINSMSDSDIQCNLEYFENGCMGTGFTNDKSILKWNPFFYSEITEASYGIRTSVLWFNKFAVGYTPRIIFITDSSIFIDNTNVRLAIENKIPIYFICISDFNTATLNGYAQLTGGKVYNAKTTEEINQVCSEIGEKAFKGEIDTDGDGFSDVEEMTGLLVDSSCNPIKTNYMKPDTDDDGLDDNVEVDVELTKVEIPGKQGNPSIVKYYHHMWSDPSLPDTDDDGLNDKCDPKPNNIINNSTFYIENMTSNQVKDMQKWLEALGYLDMQGNEYGRYGSLTQTAVCLYQINHGFQPSRFISPKDYDEFGPIPITNVDSLTFATIANEYFNVFGNGKQDYDDYFKFLKPSTVDQVGSTDNIFFEYKAYYSETPQIAPILTDEQINNGISIAKVSNMIFYDFEYVINSQPLDLYVYDYTNVINRKFDMITKSEIATTDFYNNVKPNGCWDVKTSYGWNLTFGIENQEGFISYNFPFIYRKAICSPEILGNIMYGYMGSWIGFSEDVLLKAGSVVSVITSGELDNSRDRLGIQLGVKYYEEDKR